MVSPISLSYPIVPYPSRVYRETHPDHLAALAALFGLSAPAVEHCRVLEVGCNDGSNLIPMALSLPQGRFTGIDLAAAPIETARALAKRLGVANVDFRAMDLMEVSPEFGEFDYIVAHGFYSWTPAAVKEKLLAVCGANLSATGMAYISYNTHPAGHVRQALREIMLFHGAGQEKAVLQFLSDSVDDASAWKAMLRQEGEPVLQQEDGVILQDMLNPFYAPVVFSEFAADAGRHGLQFVCEAKLRDTLEPPLRPEVLEQVREWSGGDVVRYEQYMDYLLYRGFRRSVLCRSEQTLLREGLAERMSGLLAASPLRKTTTLAAGAVRFAREGGPGTMETNNTTLIEALARLEECWPQGKPVREMGVDLAEVLLSLAVNGMVELRTIRPRLAAGIERRPVASPLARWQAGQGAFLTNLLHAQVEIQDAAVRFLVQLLDGTRDRQALAASLLTEAPLPPKTDVDAFLNGALHGLFRMGFLIG